MSSGRLFQATGPATQNARLPSFRLFLCTTKSPQAASSGTESRKVENSRNWDAQFVEINFAMNENNAMKRLVPSCVVLVHGRNVQAVLGCTGGR